jgi:hypothetical protein
MSGSDPTTMSYNASAVCNIYNAMSSLERFGNKNFFNLTEIFSFASKNPLAYYNTGVVHV